MYATKLEELAERLCARLRRVDDEAENDEDHSAPGEYVKEHAAEYGVDLDAMRQIDVGDCGWIVPLRHDGQWAVVTYHYGAGWECYVGEYIPVRFAKQLTEILSRRLCARLQQMDAEGTDDPSEYVRRHSAEYGVDVPVMDRLDVGEYARIFPLRFNGQWAAVLHHLEEGWESCAPDNLPEQIFEQLPT